MHIEVVVICLSLIIFPIVNTPDRYEALTGIELVNFSKEEKDNITD